MHATSYRIPVGIVLVSVAWMAWLSSRPFPRVPVIEGSSALSQGSPSTSDDVHAMSDALRRGSLLGPIEDDAPPPAGARPSPPAFAQVAPCTDPLRLVATATAHHGLALIADGGARAALYRVGAHVGTHTLVAIRARDVVLEDEAGHGCTLAMSGRTEGAPIDTALTSSTAIERGSRSPDRTSRAAERASRAPERTSRGATPLPGALRSAIGRVRVRPHVENGRTVGVRLTGVRTSVVLAALGFEDGDVIRAVNGYAIATPDEALRAYAALRDAPRLTVSFERQGAPRTIDVNVR